MGNNIYFKYYNGTTDDSRNTIKSTVENFKKKTKSNFLNGFTFYLVNNYKDLPTTSYLTNEVKKNAESFTYTGGMTLPISENRDKKEIIINSAPYFGISKLWKKNRDKEDIAQATMHEIGHQFDDQFGNGDKKLLEQIKKFPYDNWTKEQEDLYDKYLKQKDLSDAEDFKKAWQKDVEKLGQSKWNNFIFKEKHLDYYVWDVDITDGVTAKEVEEADSSRAEIFAQLFSYAMGEDDGQKEDIIRTYSNSYRIVKEKIKKHLDIDT